MLNLLASHWAPVFEAKATDGAAARHYLNCFGFGADLGDRPPPTLYDIQRCLQRLGSSAPGPDMLPYDAWENHPQGAEVLPEVLSRMLE
eukprot:8072838-Pyramimonas_sp.AAC.2